MPVKIKDIDGVLIEKEIQSTFRGDMTDDEYRKYRSGFIAGLGITDSYLSQQGEVQIGLNREKLAKKLFKMDRPDMPTDSYQWEHFKEEYLSKADELIAVEKELIERKI